MKIRVSVPASAGNTGSAFDSLGIAYGLTNEVILLTKDSSLVYLLGMGVGQYELTKYGREAISGAGAGLTPLVVAGVCYLIITVPLGILTRRFESKTDRMKKS